MIMLRLDQLKNNMQDKSNKTPAQYATVCAASVMREKDEEASSEDIYQLLAR